MSRNKNHSSRKVIVAITGVLMGIVAGSVGTVYAQGNDINPVVETRNNETEDHLNKLNNSNEIASKSIEKASELLKYEKNEKNIINEKIDWESKNGREFLNQIKSNVENADKEQEIKRTWLATINGLSAIYPDNENLRKVKAILEEDIKKDEQPSGNKKENKEIPKDGDKKEVKTTNIEAENNVLTAKLSGRDVTVSFDKNKINADAVFVGAINDEKLNEKIINKLGSEYKVVEVFEIHFTKDGKKLDSGENRTVKVSVVKNNDAKLEVYHIADNNVLEKIDNSKFSNGVVEFTVDHFSKFAILERIRVGAKDLESRVQIVTPVKAEYNEEKIATTKNSDVNNKNTDKKAENKKKENEDLPKTGLETTETLGIALLALGSAIAIRRRQMQ